MRERERARIAREIHDELGQMLTVLKMDVESLAAYVDSARCKTRMESLSKHLDDMLSAVRKISTNLRPPLLDGLGLAAALEHQAQEFASRTRIRCTVTGLRRKLPLAPEQATGVFRIVQELLTNVARHANATAVEVAIHRRPYGLEMIVSDDGCGIQTKAASNGNALGLMGMRERAVLLGGSIRLQRLREGGTRAILRLPASGG